MSKLISDYAQVQISNKVKDILRVYHSSNWHSEPYHKNQNPSEWHYRTIKAWTKHHPQQDWKKSGLTWSQRIHDIMLQLCFRPCKADPCVWLREMKDKYEYIAIYVDDLLMASEEPQKIIQDLKEKFKLKIKGDSPLDYHLGCDYKLDKDGTLVTQPTRYINKILESYKKMFPDEDFLNAKSPLGKNDHPELDNSELCNEEQITKYMYMIGQL